MQPFSTQTTSPRRYWFQVIHLDHQDWLDAHGILIWVNLRHRSHLQLESIVLFTIITLRVAIMYGDRPFGHWTAPHIG